MSCVQISSPHILGTKTERGGKDVQEIDLGPFQGWPVLSLREHEWFHLHLLLHVPGATGYDDLKTVNGVVHNTFKEASVARGLIAYIRLWVDLIREAIASQMPRQMRRMFAYMLVFCKGNDLVQIWEEFCDSFCEDYTHRGLCRDAAYLRCLGDILSVLMYNGYDLKAFSLLHEGVIVNGDIVDQMEAVNEDHEERSLRKF